MFSLVLQKVASLSATQIQKVSARRDILLDEACFDEIMGIPHTVSIVQGALVVDPPVVVLFWNHCLRSL
jgi:hypothetical protein